MQQKNPLEDQMTKGYLPATFLPAAIIIIILVSLTVIFPDQAGTTFSNLNGFITKSFGWFYTLSVVIFLSVCLIIAFSKFGQTRLGADNEKPRYNFMSWVAMLFSAGMGIGLLFFSVGEPILHYITPPIALESHDQLAKQAVNLTFLHWGLHGWAIYTIIGLCLAYFGFRHGLPLTIRSALYPLIGDRIYGPIGHIVDVTAVLGTLFGVATSLGFGASQINSGLNFLFDVPVSNTVQIFLIIGISGLATISVVAGLDAGIKRLSEINLILALGLLVFVVALGPTVLIFSGFTENIGNYLSAIIDRGMRVGVYSDEDGWINSWTIFYWGWWISWSPFVGMFIARISRGRTIREFIFGVLFVPTLLVFFWMTTFGNTALDMVGNGFEELALQVKDNMPIALFVFLDQLPFSMITSILALVLIVTFFVTSSDSGSLVIDIITSGGRIENPVWQRIFWAVTQGVVAAVLLLAGGLGALQAATVAMALPFTVVILFSIGGLLRGLSMEGRIAQGAETAPDIVGGGVNMPWRLRLNAILAHPSKEAVIEFIDTVARPALVDVMDEIKSHDVCCKSYVVEGKADLWITHEGEPSFRFAVIPTSHQAPVFAIEAATDNDNMLENPDTYYRAEVSLSSGGQEYDIFGYNKEQIIHEVLNQYNRHMHYLNISREYHNPLEQE
ncbi:BCCT family transporter [Temperatibacter marinus]|uniref:BCCT family transporter n=1 Tax=Temperatibacter marinus TaxID=1456591 RepID=A0AA52H8N1_9PROT|nr:BCCT family transporter [Temperatibacter marinus]WND02019.1 BCCT family transporter [Temperatibacter marinus]